MRRAAGGLDPAAPLVLSATLVRNEAIAGIRRGRALVAAETRDWELHAALLAQFAGDPQFRAAVAADLA